MLSIIGSLILTIGFILFIPSLIIPELIEAFTLFIDVAQKFVQGIFADTSILNDIDIINNVDINWNELMTKIVSWADETKGLMVDGIICI